MANIGITKFAASRHFNNPEFAGTKVVGMTPEELLELANMALENGAELQPGYASFCKHLFVENWTRTVAGVAMITPDNAHLLRSDYVARRKGELPVLTRWFEGLVAPPAEYLDLVLYSRNALEDEASKAPSEMERDVPEADWGIVSINGELQDSESPLNPTTMLRNALGKEQGGSGVALDASEYEKAVNYWRTHAVVK